MDCDFRPKQLAVELLFLNRNESFDLAHFPSGRPHARNDLRDYSRAYSDTHQVIASCSRPWRIGLDVERANRTLTPALHSQLKLWHPLVEPLTAWTLSEAFFKCMDSTFRPEALRIHTSNDDYVTFDSPILKEKNLVALGYSWIERQHRLSIVFAIDTTVAALGDIEPHQTTYYANASPPCLADTKALACLVSEE
jgi:hypothetical protein